MQLFYCDRIEGEMAYLSPAEVQHATRVLRHKVGDELNLLDGKGGQYLGRIVDIGKDRCQLELLSHHLHTRRASFRLHIAIAPTKNIDRFEWFLEKATEIGIDRISPILCQRSERKRIREDRLEKVILSALKQSKQWFLPQLDELTKFSDFINAATNQQKFIAWCDEAIPQHLGQVMHAVQDTLILIGPEGDFSPEEVAQAKAAEYTEISLGPTRLRTETAGIVAAHTANFVNL